jgi:large subunit ribosomal protein L35e
MAKKTVKATELRGKNKEELEKQLNDLKQELYNLRVQKVTGGQTTNLLNIKHVRRSIARVLGVLAEKQRAEVKKVFQNKKYKPLDLRTKGTRAFRRRLTTSQANAKVLRVTKRQSLFPQRRFAVLA